MFTIAAAIFIISGSVLAYEVALMRVFSITQWHHLAYMVVSVALLGFGASGTLLSLWGARLRRHFEANTTGFAAAFALSIPLSFALTQRVPFDAFQLVCQTFQGWAVWRAPGYDPENMEMLGLFDRVNPETCIEGYCGNVSYDPIPQCFRAKRAACFVTKRQNPDEVRLVQ